MIFDFGGLTIEEGLIRFQVQKAAGLKLFLSELSSSEAHKPENYSSLKACSYWWA